MPLEDYLKPITDAFELPALPAGETVCTLTLPNGLEVTVEEVEAEEALHFYSPVAAVPVSGAERLYSRLLQAQLFHREIGEGCCFALDYETNCILLNRMLTVDPFGDDAPKVTAALNEFANWASHWRDALADFDPSVHDSGPEDEDEDQDQDGDENTVVMLRI